MKGLVKRLFNVVGLEISRKSRPFTKAELAEQYYQSQGRKFEWLKSYNFSHIIDVGANEGQFAGSISTIFPETNIFCFEPIKLVFDQLCNNFKGNPHFKFYNYALGENDEDKEIFVNEYSPSSSLMEMMDLHKNSFEYARKTVPEVIKVRQLDSFFTDVVMPSLLLKLDVQGYEMYVLKGGPKLVGHSRVIIIETSFYPLYHGQPLFGDIYSYLTNLGFEYLGNIEQLNAPIDQKILQADAVFVNRNSF